MARRRGLSKTEFVALMEDNPYVRRPNDEQVYRFAGIVFSSRNEVYLREEGSRATVKASYRKLIPLTALEVLALMAE
jgi:hypothetical protein